MISKLAMIVFPVCGGSVVRVVPIPSRGMRNSSDEAMIYIVV